MASKSIEGVEMNDLFAWESLPYLILAVMFVALFALWLFSNKKAKVAEAARMKIYFFWRAMAGGCELMMGAVWIVNGLYAWPDVLGAVASIGIGIYSLGDALETARQLSKNYYDPRKLFA